MTILNCTRLSRLVALIVVLICGWIPPSFSQISTVGKCSPVVISNGGILNIRCPTTVVTSHSYALDSTAISSIAQFYNITDIAVQNFFEQINGESVPPYLLPERLDTLVTEVRRLRRELEAVKTIDSLRPLWANAMRALANGQINEAIAVHKEIVSLADRLVDNASNTLLEAGRVHRSLGELYVLTYKYTEAASQYKVAIQIVPAKFKLEHARLKTLWAEALFLTGSDDDEASEAALEAVSATNETYLADPEFHLRALAAQLRTLVVSDSKGAIALFENRIAPLLGQKELKGSSIGLLCFACTGRALLKLKDYNSAAILLERGIEYSKNRIYPDRTGLASIYLTLSDAYYDLDQIEKAASALAAAKSLFLQAFPNDDHPDISYIYLREGSRSDDSDFRKTAYMRSFRVASSLLAFSQPTYRTVLESVLYHAVAHGSLPNQKKIGRQTITFSRFYPESDYFDAIYDMHMANVRSITNDLEEIADQSNFFAQKLYEGNYSEESILFYKKTANLYTQGQIGEALGVARFMSAQIMDFQGLGASYEIEEGYSSALEVYNQVLGPLTEYAQDARFKLVAHYIREGQRDKAASLISRFQAAAGSARNSEKTKEYLSELRSLLKAKQPPSRR